MNFDKPNLSRRAAELLPSGPTHSPTENKPKSERPTHVERKPSSDKKRISKQSSSDETKNKRDQARLPRKRHDEIKTAAKQQKYVEKQVAAVIEQTVTPIPVPTNIQPMLRDDRIVYGCMHPVANNMVVIDGWDSFIIPIKYIDFHKPLHVKKGKEIILTMDKYIFYCKPLTITELTAILWRKCVPRDFRSVEISGVCGSQEGKDQKQEVIDPKVETELTSMVNKIATEEDAEANFDSISHHLMLLQATQMEDSLCVTLFYCPNNGLYYNKIGEDYYDYNGKCYVPIELTTDEDYGIKLGDRLNYIFNPIRIPMQCMAYYKPLQPYITIRIGNGVSPNILKEIEQEFKLNVIVGKPYDYPNVVELLTAALGHNSPWMLLPGENLLKNTSFSADCYDIYWPDGFSTRHFYTPGGRKMGSICGFDIYTLYGSKPPRRKIFPSVPYDLIQLYPVPVESSWTRDLIAFITDYFNNNIFPSIGDRGWKWADPKNVGLKVYRTKHDPATALYVIQVVDKSLPKRLFFIPGIYLRLPLGEVSIRNPDRNWMGQVMNAVHKLVDMLKLPPWIVQPITLGIYLDFHHRVGEGLFKHYSVFAPHLTAISEVRNLKKVTEKENYNKWIFSARTWFYQSFDWAKLLLLLLYVFQICFVVGYYYYTDGKFLTALKPASSFGILVDCAIDMIDWHLIFFLIQMTTSVVIEEVIKHQWFLMSYVFGVFEFWYWGRSAWFNLLLHVVLGCLSLKWAICWHMVYNLHVYSKMVTPLAPLVPFILTVPAASIWDIFIQMFKPIKEPEFYIHNYGQQQWQVVPLNTFFHGVQNQIIKIQESVRVELFTIPLLFPASENKISSLTDQITRYQEFKCEFIDPVTNKPNVVIEAKPEHFGHKQENQMDLDTKIELAGPAIYGMACLDMLPRRQHSLNLNCWTSLFEYRLKRVNTYDPLFKKKIWDKAYELSLNTQGRFAPLEKYMLKYGLTMTRNGVIKVDVNPETDHNRRMNMLKNFTGQKRKDYEEGYEKVFSWHILSTEWTDEKWLKNYSLLVQKYYSKFRHISLAHKKDELLLKEGDIKPRPIFFLPVTLRALMGPFMWAAKQAVFLNNFPFLFNFKLRATDYLIDYDFMKTAINTKLTTQYLFALGTSPLELSLWFTLTIIYVTKSTNVFDWVRSWLLIADGTSYDLSGTSHDHQFFALVLIALGVPESIADICRRIVTDPKTVTNDEWDLFIMICNIFFSGLGETSFFNSERNLGSAKFTLDMFETTVNNTFRHAHAGGGDDYIGLLGNTLTATERNILKTNFLIDQGKMGVTSKVSCCRIPNGDFYSSMLIPALTEQGHEILVLTLKIGKLLKSGSSHSQEARMNPWVVLFNTSYVWEKVTRHMPIAHAIASFHVRLAKSKGGHAVREKLEITGNPELKWADDESMAFYSRLRPSKYIDEYVYTRYGIDTVESTHFIDFCEHLPLETLLITHPTLNKIIQADLI